MEPRMLGIPVNGSNAKTENSATLEASLYQGPCCAVSATNCLTIARITFQTVAVEIWAPHIRGSPYRRLQMLPVMYIYICICIQVSHTMRLVFIYTYAPYIASKEARAVPHFWPSPGGQPGLEKEQAPLNEALGERFGVYCISIIRFHSTVYHIMLYFIIHLGLGTDCADVVLSDLNGETNRGCGFDPQRKWSDLSSHASDLSFEPTFSTVASRETTVFPLCPFT